MTTHLLSQHAFDRLQAELEDLTTRGRIEVASKIERARELGDLSENGDYHAAKDEQGHMEGRIRQLESLLEHAEIVDPPADGVVGPGSIVTVIYEGDDESAAERYLVGHIEERQGDLDVVSPESPLGMALIGARDGEWVTYQAPNGELRVKVLKAETVSVRDAAGSSADQPAGGTGRTPRARGSVGCPHGRSAPRLGSDGRHQLFSRVSVARRAVSGPRLRPSRARQRHPHPAAVPPQRLRRRCRGDGRRGGRRAVHCRRLLDGWGDRPDSSGDVTATG